MNEQLEITKRFKLRIYGKKNINEQTILAVRFYYNKEEDK